MEHGTSVQQQKVMENHTENISLKMAKLEDNTEKLDRLKEGKVSLFFFSFLFCPWDDFCSAGVLFISWKLPACIQRC